MPKPRPWGRGAQALALAILLLSTWLRFYRLDYQSYWHDEGNSLHLAGESVSVILQSAAADIHPPAYYLLLKTWRIGLGETEFALRSLSALAGVVLVALTFRLGRLFFNPTAALVAAALAAINPFLIYYAQEARMYALAATLGAASFGLFAIWLKGAFHFRGGGEGHPSGWAIGAAYIAVSAWGLYTHYAFGFIIIAQNAVMAAYFLGALWAARRSGLRPALGQTAAWLGLQAFTLLLYLPWLPVAYHQLTNWPAAREFHPFFSALADVARYLALGRTIETGAAGPALIMIGFMLLIGLFVGGLRRSLVPLFWLLIPVGLTLAFGLLSETFSKFLLVAVPPLCLLLGQAIGRLGQPKQPAEGRSTLVLRLSAFGILTIGAMALTAPSLENLYFNPIYFRDDYRGMAQYVESVQRPGDAIILIAPNQMEAFGYYHRSGAEVFPLPHARPLDPAETTRALEAISADHARLFVLYWADEQADPDHFVEGWLNVHTFKAGDTWYGQVRLATYAVSTPATEIATRSGAQFSVNTQVHISLEGYTLQAGELSPGDILQLTLFWQTDAALTERYKVFVHVYADPAQPPLAQQDGEPGGGLLITSQWTPGQRYADNHGVALPADLPPGRYTLAIGLYNLFDGTRLAATLEGQALGERLELGTITIK
jgi:mannosyltransferase